LSAALSKTESVVNAKRIRPIVMAASKKDTVTKEGTTMVWYGTIPVLVFN